MGDLDQGIANQMSPAGEPSSSSAATTRGSTSASVSTSSRVRSPSGTTSSRAVSYQLLSWWMPWCAYCLASSATQRVRSLTPSRTTSSRPPIYTRPADYKGWKVPDVLLSGHAARIEAWKMECALERTKRLRPDLYKKHLGHEK